MAYWLVKTEPEVYSIQDLKRDKSTLWEGVRNYQARNFLSSMKIGDQVLIYHSNAEPPGVAGIGVVKELAQPDPSQFDSQSEYFDPNSKREAPRWVAPKIGFLKIFDNFLALESLKVNPKLSGLALLRRGNRLSVMPVTEAEFSVILKM
jgi:predicted RNA-binding protein with PUA-like domain